MSLQLKVERKDTQQQSTKNHYTIISRHWSQCNTISSWKSISEQPSESWSWSSQVLSRLGVLMMINNTLTSPPAKIKALLTGPAVTGLPKCKVSHSYAVKPSQNLVFNNRTKHQNAPYFSTEYVRYTPMFFSFTHMHTYMSLLLSKSEVFEIWAHDGGQNLIKLDHRGSSVNSVTEMQCKSYAVDFQFTKCSRWLELLMCA